ncbi:MAG: LacI family DNA-binding transcriptional regulator [Fimbriimonas sp.]
MAITIRDVAERAKTSISAVSVTLSGKSDTTIRVSPATRERIYEAAAQLGYSSNPIARSLATGKSKVIGLILPYADAFVDENPFCHLVMTGVMREVVQHHYNLMMYTAAASDEHSARQVDSRVEGLILVMPPENSQVVAKCEKRGRPYVSILRDPVPGAWTVNSDDFEGGRLVAQHFIRLGHRRMAILMGPSDVSTSAPRFEGFKSALAEAGIPLNPKFCVESGFDWYLGLDSMEQILAEPGEHPTAVFAINDLCAEGAIRALHRHGLSVPGDVAVVGYDDTWFSTMTRPPLTTVHMPIQAMGAMAAKLLIQRIEGVVPENTQPILPVRLTIRHSCGASLAHNSKSSTDSISQDNHHETSLHTY